MHEVNTLQTQPLQLNSHNRSKTIAFSTWQLKGQNRQTPLKEHFKAFLINHTRQFSIKNAATVYNRVKQLRSHKKQTACAQVFDQSIPIKFTLQNFVYQNKTIEPINCNISDLSKQKFNQVFSARHRRNFSDRIQSKLESLPYKNTSKKDIENQAQIKSFGTFLASMKRKNFMLENGGEKNGQLIEQTINESLLKIQGNQKVLMRKNLKCNNNQKPIEQDNLKSTILSSHQVKENEQTVKKYQMSKKSAKNKEKNVSQIKKQSNKSIKRVSGCLKNVYSPFNGIQIRYISSETQPTFQTSFNSVEQKNKALVVNSFKKPVIQAASNKKNVANNIQKGIIFRPKQSKAKPTFQSIDGWNIQPSKDELLDLCIQF